MREKKDAVRTNLRKAYQHIVYLGEAREAVSVRLDKDAQTALDGTLVWKTLADRETTFGQDEFNKPALLFQLRESDYGKSLATIRRRLLPVPATAPAVRRRHGPQVCAYAAQQAEDIVILNSSGQPRGCPPRRHQRQLQRTHPRAADPARAGRERLGNLRGRRRTCCRW